MRWTVGCGHNRRKIMDDEMLSYELNGLQNEIAKLKDYVKHMTYFCSGVAVVLTFILYSLISKGLFF